MQYLPVSNPSDNQIVDAHDRYRWRHPNKSLSATKCINCQYEFLLTTRLKTHDFKDRNIPIDMLF